MESQLLTDFSCYAVTEAQKQIIAAKANSWHYLENCAFIVNELHGNVSYYDGHGQEKFWAYIEGCKDMLPSAKAAKR